MSTISASTTTTTAYKVTADTTGTLVFQTGATPTTALTIDSSQNITTANKFAKASMPTGSVLQVVNSSVGYVSTTSASLTDTGLTASITPRSASNQVLVTVCLNGINMTGAGSFAFTLTDGSNNVLAYLYNYNNQYPMTGWTASILMSPATTSSYTYKVRFNSNGSTTLRLNDYSANAPSSYITLMEIAA